MKRLLVANKQKSSKSRYSSERMEIMLQAQIDNLLSLGWQTENLILLTNFDFEFMGVEARVIKLNDFCLTGSKIFALKWLFDHNQVNDITYSADLDCWQGCHFDCPSFQGDVGACHYSNPKWNGGSIFWKPSSKDIVDEIVKQLTIHKASKEEPLLNKIFNANEYRDRISLLNSTFNVGCSGFFERFTRSEKPIRVAHFNPQNSIAWEIHSLDRDGLGEIAVTVRLERLLRRYYPDLATELRDKTISEKKQKERDLKKEKHKKKKEIKGTLGIRN